MLEFVWKDGWREKEKPRMTLLDALEQPLNFDWKVSRKCICVCSNIRAEVISYSRCVAHTQSLSCCMQPISFWALYIDMRLWKWSSKKKRLVAESLKRKVSDSIDIYRKWMKFWKTFIRMFVLLYKTIHFWQLLVLSVSVCSTKRSRI